jgi:hypothetical protein
LPAPQRYATDACFEVANSALQLLGGYGYLQEYPIERYMRDLRVHCILEGTNEIMRLIINRPAACLWFPFSFLAESSTALFTCSLCVRSVLHHSRGLHWIEPSPTSPSVRRELDKVDPIA